jgi:predicted aspartyl protease
MDINGKNTVESVIDPGSSIIAMSKDICHELGLAYDPSICLPM